MENNENEKKTEKEDLVFNTPNELKIKVTKFTGQTILDEDCCTSLNMVVKNDGQIQGNFLGAYNEELLKLLKRATKEYFKVLKKNLKSKPNEENISVESDTTQKSQSDTKTADKTADKGANKTAQNKADVSTKSAGTTAKNANNKQPKTDTNTRAKTKAKSSSKTNAKSSAKTGKNAEAKSSVNPGEKKTQKQEQKLLKHATHKPKNEKSK